MIQYNGFNPDRRRMFVNNPRNNLNSSVSFVWADSLHEEGSPRQYLERRKQYEHQLINHQYNERIDRRLQETLGLAASQRFRVFVPQQEQEALSKELAGYNSKSLHQQPLRASRSIDARRDNLGEVTFGYSISSTPRPSSYLHEAIESRLRPHLKGPGGQASSAQSASQHQSFTLNQPINLHY